MTAMLTWPISLPVPNTYRTDEHEDSIVLTKELKRERERGEGE